MRARKKKHGAERIAACASLLINDTSALAAEPQYAFPVKSNKLCLEIGCGKGDFACGMSLMYPDINFIAMEKMPDIICTALEKAMASESVSSNSNLRFLIGDAKYLPDYLSAHCLDTIYVNFCDPWPKKGHARRRLTSPSFLEIYGNLLKAEGRLKFKTDNRDLFDYSMEQFEALGLNIINFTYDLHSSPLSEGNVMTEYERNFSAKGFSINYAEVGFPAKADGSKSDE